MKFSFRFANHKIAKDSNKKFKDRVYGSFNNSKSSPHESHFEFSTKEGAFRYTKESPGLETSLNQSNFKSVPILFEKQRSCNCNTNSRDHLDLPMNSDEYLNASNSNSNTMKTHLHQHVLNQILDNRVQTQCKICGSLGSFPITPRTEINEV